MEPTIGKVYVTEPGPAPRPKVRPIRSLGPLTPCPGVRMVGTRSGDHIGTSRATLDPAASRRRRYARDLDRCDALPDRHAGARAVGVVRLGDAHSGRCLAIERHTRRAVHVHRDVHQRQGRQPVPGPGALRGLHADRADRFGRHDCRRRLCRYDHQAQRDLDVPFPVPNDRLMVRDGDRHVRRSDPDPDPGADPETDPPPTPKPTPPPTAKPTAEPTARTTSRPTPTTDAETDPEAGRHPEADAEAVAQAPPDGYASHDARRDSWKGVAAAIGHQATTR